MKSPRSCQNVLLCCSILLFVGYSGIMIFLWSMHNLMRHPSIPTDDQLALRTLYGHIGGIGLGFTPNGQRLLSVSSDHTAKVWNTDSWSEECTFLDHKYGIVSLAVSRNLPYAVTGDGDAGVIVWDINTCEQKASISRPAFITALAFGPDDDDVLVVAHDITYSLTRWNYCTGDQHTIPGEWDRAVSARLPTLGPIIITSSRDGSVVIWDKLLKNRIETLPISCGREHLLSSVSRNGRLAVSRRNTAVIWDLDATKKICEFESPLMNTISSICLSPNGNYLVLTGCVWAYEPGMIEIVDANSGKLLRRLRAHESVTHSSAISPDERFLATGGGKDNSIKIWPIHDLCSAE